MPRRKPASSKQRKAELQLKRAIKRGDVPAPPPQPRKQKARRTPLDATKPSDPSSKRLQSAFLNVEPEFLEKSKLVAATAPLPRPLPAEAAVLRGEEVGLHVSEGVLTCPRRPKWRFDMSKKEVERNEEGVFQKWVDEVDARVDAWRGVGHEDPEPLGPSQGRENDALPTAPRSPTYYERNLEVWRQLWRVSEISQIILLLLDSRCPAIHFPRSLHTFLTSLRPTHPVVLVLTKSDLVPASHTAAWSTWLRDRYPSARVVKVQSYREQDENQERIGQGQRKKFEPQMKQDDLDTLVQALKAAHAELLEPPEKLKNDPEKLKNWKPNVRQAVDWEAALRGGRAQVDQPADASGEEYITIGLIGQPNVGKSSLLNALFGTHKVKASRTPGKTKHFQTLFWTPDIRLVDCPGLVMPNLVHMELQVLCGILPISQIPSIPACINYALLLLPLERILHLAHPTSLSDASADKRTWRGERPAPLRHAAVATQRTWTTMDVLTAHAAARGWVTAKAGRPDTHRAGNALLRALAEGRIHWAFWPPGVPLPSDYAVRNGGDGIWLGDGMEDTEDEEDGESDAGEGGSDAESGSTDEGELSVSEEKSDEGQEFDTVGVGRFGALILEDGEDEDEDEDEVDETVDSEGLH